MSAGYCELGPLSYQRHTDWRCSTVAWRRGRRRPVVSLRFGRAARLGFGFFVDRDEDDTWQLNAALFRVDIMASLTGPWEAAK